MQNLIEAIKHRLNDDFLKSGKRIDYVHYVNGVDDPEKNYCSTCVVYKRRHASKKASRDNKDYIHSGCMDSMPEDQSCFCAGCSSPLDHSFTDYGAFEEINHFIENPPESISGNELLTFELLRVFEHEAEKQEEDSYKSLLENLAGKIVELNPDLSLGLSSH